MGPELCAPCPIVSTQTLPSGHPLLLPQDLDRSSPIAKLNSFLAQSADLVSVISYHHQMTQWLEETFLPLPDWCSAWPRIAAYRLHFIHQRKRVKESAENAICGTAVVINVFVMVRAVPRKARSVPHPTRRWSVDAPFVRHREWEPVPMVPAPAEYPL